MSGEDETRKLPSSYSELAATISPEFLDAYGTDLWNRPEVIAGHERLYEQAYKELCFPVTGKAPSDTPPGEIAFQEEVRAFLERNRESLHQKICVEFDFCNRKKKMKSRSDFLFSLIGLIGILADFASCGAAAALWLTSTNLLDWFCECEA